MSFGALILLMGVLGGLAVWRINLAVKSATDVATKRAPEVQIANLVDNSVWKTRFYMRPFALTGDEELLRNGRRMLATLKGHLKEAHDLAVKFPDLVALDKGETEAMNMTTEYEALVDRVEAEYKNLAVQEAAFDDAGNRFVQACQSLRLEQRQHMNGELEQWTAQTAGKEVDQKATAARGTLDEKVAKEKVDLALLRERIVKMGLVEDLIDVGSAIQIKNFKFQRERDMEALRGVLKDFVTLERIAANLSPLLLTRESNALMGKIQQAAEDYRTAMEKVLKSRLAIAEGAKNMVATSEIVTGKASEVADGGMRSIEKAANEVVSGLSLTSVILLVGLLIALIVGGVVAWLSTRAITGPIREGVNALASTASQISATISQLASNASEAAAAVAETTTTVEEVRQTAQVAADKAKAVADNAQGAARAAEAGRQATAQTVQGLGLIRDQMSSIGETITRLSEQSQAVGDIVSTVTDLAEQSNLLAVNASIEAAKAGDQGKGFAVVAQEIRNLAEQSKESTKQVRAILTEVQKATGKAVLASEQGGKSVADGGRQADEAGQAIGILTATVQDATRAAVQIAASSQQQLVGMEQVGRAMENIRQATTQNAEGARQLATAAHNLQEIGTRLKELVDTGSEWKQETRNLKHE
jgi:methyl-accepting chemotaxis protein